MSRATVNPGAITGRYLELVREFPLRPIRTKADYRRAGKIIDRLATQEEGSLAPGEQDYLDTLSLLVEEYDRASRPHVRQVDPIIVLRHLMDESDMNVTDLGELLGSKSIASEVLNGRRSLSKANMLALAKHFKLDVSAFFPRA